MKRYLTRFHRRSIRLKGFDYAKPGLYFITVCAQNHARLFGKIINNQMVLNEPGKMLETEWLAMKIRFPNIDLHEFIIMPDHLHSILQIVDNNIPAGATLVVAPNDIPVAPINNPVAPINNPIAPINNPIAPINNPVAPINNPVAPNGFNINLGATTRVAPTIKSKTIGHIMDAYKSITTVKYIHGVKKSNWPQFNGKLWQRNYYEHIIRDYESYQRIRKYIMENPVNWGQKLYGHP